MYETCSKLTIKKPERWQMKYFVKIVDGFQPLLRRNTLSVWTKLSQKEYYIPSM